MGEMADMYNEYQEGTLCDAYNYASGVMGAEEAFELGMLSVDGMCDVPDWIWNLAVNDSMSTYEEVSETLHQIVSGGGIQLPCIRRVHSFERLDSDGAAIYNGMIDRLMSGRCLTEKQRDWIYPYTPYGVGVLERKYRKFANYSEFLESAYKNIARLILKGRTPSEKQQTMVHRSYYGGLEWFHVDVKIWASR